MAAKPTIKVQYANVDGAHFFTSTEKEGLGLCAASTDLKVAFDEVSVQLSVLLGQKVAPAITFEQFCEWIEKHIQDSAPSPIQTLAAAQWKYGEAA